MEVGDYGFYDFELCQIKEMQDGRITEVSDGHCSHGSHDLTSEWFPLSLRNKNISRTFFDLNNKVHETGFNFINYPDIKNYLTSQWVRACYANDKKVIEIIEETREFVKDALEYIDGVRKHTINGVRIVY